MGTETQHPAPQPGFDRPDASAATAKPATRRFAIGAAAASAALLAQTAARAAAPPNPDPALHEWFDRQRSVRGILCCSIADGHILSDEEWRINGAFYEVFIRGEWHRVLPSQLRDTAGGPNPTGRAIVWYAIRDHVVIYCFAPGTEL